MQKNNLLEWFQQKAKSIIWSQKLTQRRKQRVKPQDRRSWQTRRIREDRFYLAGLRTDNTDKIQTNKGKSTESKMLVVNWNLLIKLNLFVDGKMLYWTSDYKSKIGNSCLLCAIRVLLKRHMDNHVTYG